MIGIVWNCRGIGQASTVRSLKLLIKEHRPLFLFISEVKCSSSANIQSLVFKLGFLFFEFVPSRGKAGGLLLAWKDKLDLKIVISSENFINALVFEDAASVPWQLTMVYGPPVPTMRHKFWADLEEIGGSFSGAWSVVGDFNAVLNSCDKMGGNPVASSSRGGFRKLIDDNGLIDMGFEGHAYTWNNKRGGMANIQECLDRGFANAQWKTRFPSAAITHLTALCSDHRPLLFQTQTSNDNLPRPFKFETMWVSHPDTVFVIEEAWNRQEPFANRLRNTKEALKKWNKLVFGHVQNTIKEVKVLIQNVQKQPQNHEILNFERVLQHQLDDLLKREEILWKDKAKARWYEEGDANSRYFHLTTIIHRGHNTINRLQTSDNSWMINRHEIGTAFERFYTELFSASLPQFPEDLQGLFQPMISVEMNQVLYAKPEPEEVKRALFSMGSFKSPGPDGMTVNFYKSYWRIVREATTKEVQVFFTTGKLRTGMNHTFLALIPKSNNAHKVDLFRPIALCNVIYKIITKIIASRLRFILDDIISPNQAAFIPNRSIQDNVIINHEIMYYLNKKCGKKGFMAVKIDLAKAYDKVEWKVLTQVFRKLGFEENFISLVHSCISTAHFSVLLNGSPFGYFKSERGVRQGDPLSPALFTLISDVLSRILTCAEEEGRIGGVKVSRHSPRITHLMYADGLVIYCKATHEEAQEVAECVQTYCDWTGQEVNWHKSAVHYSRNTWTQLRREIGDILNIQECRHNGSYLGHPFCNFKHKKEAYKGVVERLSSKLAGWKQKVLSMAGRMVLIKSIAQAIPSHVMQSFLIPKGILMQMDSMIRDFFWGYKETQTHHLYMKAWADICLPKRSGGLGIRLMHDLNQSLITKLGWRIATEENNPCMQLIRAKYLRGRPLLDSQQLNTPASWVWNGVKQCIHLLRSGMCYQLGENSMLKIKGDPWLYKEINFKIPEDVNIPNQYILVKDFMCSAGKSWNYSLITNLFPLQISEKILNTPILELEQDRPIWTPSSTGKFTVKSAYHWSIHGRICVQNLEEPNMWKHIWNAEVHNRHKLLLWRVANNLLPTLDRLGRFLEIPKQQCLLCGQHDETLHHILLDCQISKLIWWNSPWQVRLDAFQNLTSTQWIILILHDTQVFDLEEWDRRKMKNFFVTMVEQLWFTRNKIWKGESPLEWNELSRLINQCHVKYWKGCRKQKSKARRLPNSQNISAWTPPTAGEVKLNFDAAFTEGKTATGCILRDERGSFLGAWVNQFRTDNAFCAETEAAIEALKIAESLQLERVTIEGDAMFVILALQGMEEFEDWKAASRIAEGKRRIATKCNWFLNYSPRESNACAHQLAKWAYHSNYLGEVDLSTLQGVLLGDNVVVN